MEVFAQLRDLLTSSIIDKLAIALNIPARIMEQTRNSPIRFLFALKDWNQFNPAHFDQALGNMNEYIRQIARKLDWLCSPSSQCTKAKGEKSVKTFVEMLTNEITSENWMILAGTTSKVDLKGNLEAKEMIKVCIDNNLITGELNKFSNSLTRIKQNQLADKVKSYASVFKTMSTAQFHEQINLELESEESEDHENWQLKLKKFIRKQNKDVIVILDKDTEPIESVYIPLTIVKVRAVKERVGIVESGITEIQFLRDMHEKVALETVEVVDFDKTVTTCDPSESELWCMVGSPGSGKSFLCKHFAYMYGTDALPNFQYAISIPCRSEEWHQLEETRHELKKVVDEEFILSWLALSMPTGARWSKSLSQHLLRSDGEGLFIILDGYDEFVREVPFKETLLCKLLGRRFLSQSTILVTSRPGAWSEVLYEHGHELKIDSNFQVLGFSPENRDLYFENRIDTPEKLSAVREMFYRHDEINQLALVPVNASLFCALFNESDSILSTTLSHLYTQLIVYMIRRQLSRIGLEEHSKVLLISDFHPAIRECIHAIGLEANQGIFERELTSDKKISFTIGDKVYPSDRLGLMQCHLKELSLGIHVRVWTFQHLTIQEFMAALSICYNSWKNQCYIIRYFTASTRYLSMYKMVIRFVCGILKRDAGCITPILCRHTIPKPMSFIEVAMLHQLGYDNSLFAVSDWIEFTQSYIQLTTTIIETKSEAITDHFAYFERQFPFPLYLYFESTLSPNDWHCFLLSLEFIRDFQIIEFQSDYVSAAQFHSFLTRISSCHIRYLGLLFVEDDFDTIYSYTRLFSSATLPRDTKISIYLESCDLSACLPSQHLFTVTNPFAGSLKISKSDMTAEVLQDLTNQFSSIEYLFNKPNPDSSHWSIIEQLALSHQFNGLYCEDLEYDVTVTPATLSNLSSLTELYVSQRGDPYEFIPSLLHLTSLSLLDLYSSLFISSNDSLHIPLSQLISINSHSLRQLSLTQLHKVGFDSWSSYFSCVTSCTNLIRLALDNTEFSSDEISCWYRASSALNSLAYLHLSDIPLQDSGMIVLCHSLSYHPAIRRFSMWVCELSSVSCVPLMCLIQTLKTVRTLKLSKRELSSPDPEQFQLLTQIAEECSVKIELFD